MSAAANESTTNTWEPPEFIHNYSKNIVKHNTTARNRKRNTYRTTARNMISTIATAGKSPVIKKKLSVMIPTNTAKMLALRHDMWVALDKITNKDQMAAIYLTLLSRPRNPDEMKLRDMRQRTKHKLNQVLVDVPYILKSDLDNIKRIILI